VQTLDIHHPEMPELQFVLLVTALCTSRLTVLNIPSTLRIAMFDRCWVLIHESPPPRRAEARVLDLRTWNELTVEAMAETIRAGLIEAGIHTLAWDHQSSTPTYLNTPDTDIFIDRLTGLNPHPSEPTDTAPGEMTEEAGLPPEEEGTGGTATR
jgi:hypothetical protein